MLEIHAVSVVIGYADIFAETVKYNQGLLDSWTIVTTERDEATRELCRRYAIRTLLTDDGKRNGDFNKGRMLERGMQHLPASGWHLHIDADIVLPHALHRLLGAADLDERCVYGCDRIMVRSYERWRQFQASGWLSHDWHHRVHPPAGFSVGDRWVHHTAGWVPIGFFQLAHSSQIEWHGARVRTYNDKHGDACRTDVQFGLNWDRRRRVFLPELLVAHLESEPSALGANWCGRTSKPFGPPQTSDAQCQRNRKPACPPHHHHGGGPS